MHQKASSDSVSAPPYWGEREDLLILARRTSRCTVLGPGQRAVLWVQGCPLRCPQCVATEMLPFEGGQEVAVDALAEELVALTDIEGVTFSGGEPMAQAAALCRLADQIRTIRNLSFLSYTGFALEELRSRGTVAQRGLLDRLDVLIDGPYSAARHTNLRWRGSDNQRVHFLSDRYAHLQPTVQERGIWLEFEATSDGAFGWMGIPPPAFRSNFDEKMRQVGVELSRRSPSTSEGKPS